MKVFWILLLQLIKSLATLCDGYGFIDILDGYTRDIHIQGGQDFGFGVNSTSQIESIWSQLKSILKSIYYIIAHRNFPLYLREAEWRQKNKDKNTKDKIKSFFDCWNQICDIDEENFYIWLLE